jgi:hypothetical protein
LRSTSIPFYANASKQGWYEKMKRKMVKKRKMMGGVVGAYVNAVLELLRYSQDHRGDGLVPLVPRLQLLPQVLVFAPPALDPS